MRMNCCSETQRGKYVDHFRGGVALSLSAFFMSEYNYIELQVSFCIMPVRLFQLKRADTICMGSLKPASIQ
ncbi:MAG: hypothetical protein ACI935_002139 [Moritella dasanensis]|jgi:hypothetical protein